MSHEADTSTRLSPKADSVPEISPELDADRLALLQRPLPLTKGVIEARVVRRAAENEQFLKLRQIDKGDERPAENVLAVMDELAEGEVAITMAVIGPLKDAEKIELHTRERNAVAPTLKVLEAEADPLRNAWPVVTRTFGLLGGGLRYLFAPNKKKILPADDVEPPKLDTHEKRDETEAVKRRQEKRDKPVFSVSLYAGFVPSEHTTGDPAERADQIAVGMGIATQATEKAGGDTGLELAPVDGRELLGGVARQIEGSRFSPTRRPGAIVMSAEEIFSTWGAEDDKTSTFGLTLVDNSVPVLPAPSFLADTWEPGRVMLGDVFDGGDWRRGYIRAEEFIGGALVAGSQRMGKSNWLAGVIRDLNAGGYPLFVLDPHQETVDDAIRLVAHQDPERIESGKLIAVDFTDIKSAVLWNVLDCDSDETQRTAVMLADIQMRSLSDLDGLTQTVTFLEVGYRTLAAINHAFSTYLKERARDQDAFERLHILDLLPFFRDPDFARFCTHYASRDDALLIEDFLSKTDRERAQIADPALRRLSSIAGAASLKAAIGSPYQRIDFKELYEEGVTLLVVAKTLGTQRDIGQAVMGPLYGQYLLQMEHLWEQYGRAGAGRKVSFFVGDESAVLAKGAGREMARVQAQLGKALVRAIYAVQNVEQFRQVGENGKVVYQEFERNMLNRLAFPITNANVSADSKAIFGGTKDRPDLTAEMIQRLPKFTGVARLWLSPDSDVPAAQQAPFVFRSVDHRFPRDPSHPDWEAVERAREIVYARGRERFARPMSQAIADSEHHQDRVMAQMREVILWRAKRGGGSIAVPHSDTEKEEGPRKRGGSTAVPHSGTEKEEGSRKRGQDRPSHADADQPGRRPRPQRRRDDKRKSPSEPLAPIPHRDDASKRGGFIAPPPLERDPEE